MIQFPEVQKKAQEEINRVIGMNRLPQIEDRDKLPYVESVVKEAFRWSPAVPLGFPHAMSEPRKCHHSTIPKGAIILPAVWWLLHDPEVYAEPASFSPQRYLEPRKEPDPKPFVFGYGRRACTG